MGYEVKAWGAFKLRSGTIAIKLLFWLQAIKIHSYKLSPASVFVESVSARKSWSKCRSEFKTVTLWGIYQVYPKEEESEKNALANFAFWHKQREETARVRISAGFVRHFICRSPVPQGRSTVELLGNFGALSGLMTEDPNLLCVLALTWSDCSCYPCSLTEQTDSTQASTVNYKQSLFKYKMNAQKEDPVS